MAQTYNKYPVPTFHVFRSDGSKNPDIVKHFIERMDISAIDAVEGKLKLKDNTEWTLILEPTAKVALQKASTVYCIISFQARTYGNYAIARVFDQSKVKGGK